MMWLLPAILGMVMLLSCSGERTRVTVEEPRGTDQTWSAAIEFAPPSPETIPGSQLGEQIRLGYQIVVNTQEYARPYVGNRLNCTNCHLDGGLNPNAASFVGLAAVYPEYRTRNARVNTLADRVNECFERSLNGRALPPDSSKLQAVVAYITWLSRGVPSGAALPWRGLQRIESRRPLDPGNGKNVFANKCVFCHGSDGLGTMAAPPVWGPQSYNVAAGMARVSVAAAFIKSNMPRARGWSLSDDDAYDVAAYINAQPRPDFPDKANDWPKGGKPADAPY
ncbi:MAG: c-type cytochrome [Pyrinomonadaceae bacterium]|nr:c-type cytochrome [Pyrinomonadaceae bacterium]